MAARTLFEQEALPQLAALQHFALQLCRDEQYSRDLVQETLLKAYTYFHTYREGTNCRAWLFQICKNSWFNEAKKRKYQPTTVDFQTLESGERSEVNDDDARSLHIMMSEYHAGSLRTAAFGDDVVTAFDALPADYRTVLVLCDMEGFTYDEIATFMNAPVGTIRSRIHRGRKILEGRLRDYACGRGYATQQPSLTN
jgi:RNA polymerase sigma-70 factor (ECF subfamily)